MCKLIHCEFRSQICTPKHFIKTRETDIKLNQRGIPPCPPVVPKKVKVFEVCSLLWSPYLRNQNAIISYSAACNLKGIWIKLWRRSSTFLLMSSMRYNRWPLVNWGVLGYYLTSHGCYISLRCPHNPIIIDNPWMKCRRRTWWSRVITQDSRYTM